VAGVGTVIALTIGSAAQRQGGAPARPDPPPAEGPGAISGVVIDGATGRPLPGAVVSLGRPTGILAAPSRSTTDELGRFVFTRLPDSDYPIYVSKPGYQDGQLGEAGSNPAGRYVHLRNGQWFQDARVPLWRPGAISGTVTDEAGEPVVGIPVRVLTRVMVAGRPFLATENEALTDDRGRYRMADLRPGQYVVMVPSVHASVPSDGIPALTARYTPDQLQALAARGEQPRELARAAVATGRGQWLIAGRTPVLPPSAERWAYPATFGSSTRSAGDAAVITLARGEAHDNADVRLAPVRMVTVTGEVQGAPAAKVASMTVRLIPPDLESLGFAGDAATALVGPDGRFAFAYVPAGSYTAFVSSDLIEYQTRNVGMLGLPWNPPGFLSPSGGFSSSPMGTFSYAYQNGIDVGYSGRTQINVGSEPVSGVTILLQPTTTLAGTIVQSGSGTRDVSQIEVQPANGDPLLGLKRGRVDAASGAFTVSGLLPGRYVLRLRGVQSIRSIQWAGRDYSDIPFEVTAGRDITGVVVTLGAPEEGARIRGTVRDAKGNVAEAAGVIIFPVAREMWRDYGFESRRIIPAGLSTLPGRTGTYSSRSFPPGDYLVVAVAPDQLSRWQDPDFLDAASRVATRVTLAAGETTLPDLTIVTVKVRQP
jgi:hypothetical protein